MERVKVGEVFHYYTNISVAAIRLTDGDLAIGDRVAIQGPTTNFEQPVDALQIEHVTVSSAMRGQEVGMKVQDRVRENDFVYKLVPSEEPPLIVEPMMEEPPMVKAPPTVEAMAPRKAPRPELARMRAAPRRTKAPRRKKSPRKKKTPRKKAARKKPRVKRASRARRSKARRGSRKSRRRSR